MVVTFTERLGPTEFWKAHSRFGMLCPLRRPARARSEATSGPLCRWARGISTNEEASRTQLEGFHLRKSDCKKHGRCREAFEKPDISSRLQRRAQALANLFVQFSTMGHFEKGGRL